MVVGLRRVQGCRRIVARHSVLGYQGGHKGFRIFVEQTVMAYAQAHDDVELGARFVEQRRLSDRIAHVLPHGVALFVDAYIGLRHCTHFADCAVDVKIVAAQDFSKNPALLIRPAQVAMPIF